MVGEHGGRCTNTFTVITEISFLSCWKVLTMHTLDYRPKVKQSGSLVGVRVSVIVMRHRMHDIV